MGKLQALEQRRFRISSRSLPLLTPAHFDCVTSLAEGHLTRIIRGFRHNLRGA